MLGGDFLERDFVAVARLVRSPCSSLSTCCWKAVGFFQCVAQVQADDAQRQGEGERQAPAPGLNSRASPSTVEIKHHHPRRHGNRRWSRKSSQLPRAALAGPGAQSSHENDAPVYSAAHRETSAIVAARVSAPDANGA